MGSTLSLTEAAKRAGLSRWPISRALQSGRLRGVRDNRGQWRIEAADLDAWVAEHPRTVPHDVPHEVRHGADAVLALAVELAELRARLEGAEVRATDLARERDEAHADRDRWRAMAERLVEREAERPVEPPPRPSFLARLFGQGRPHPT